MLFPVIWLLKLGFVPPLKADTSGVRADRFPSQTRREAAVLSETAVELKAAP